MSEFVHDGISPGTNRSARTTECETCGGDRFVTVRLRSPEQTMWMKEHSLEPARDRFYEEMAPCYVCNLASYETLGRKSIDPALAKQLHAR